MMIIKQGILIISQKAIENHQDMVLVLKLNLALILSYKEAKVKNDDHCLTIWYVCLMPLSHIYVNKTTVFVLKTYFYVNLPATFRSLNQIS